MTAKLFPPVELGGVTLPNRIVVSPMCQYSAVDGNAQPWHHVHYGSLAMSGAGLVCFEATHVEREGRITQGCLGLYSDENEAALKPVVEWARAWMPHVKLGIQLGHAGRKASSPRQFDKPDEFGPKGANWQRWQVYGPSALSAGERYSETPIALDVAQMEAIAPVETPTVTKVM